MWSNFLFTSPPRQHKCKERSRLPRCTLCVVTTPTLVRLVEEHCRLSVNSLSWSHTLLKSIMLYLQAPLMVLPNVLHSKCPFPQEFLRRWGNCSSAYNSIMALICGMLITPTYATIMKIAQRRSVPSTPRNPTPNQSGGIRFSKKSSLYLSIPAPNPQ